MKQKYKDYSKKFIILLFSLSFFVGFFLRENIAGGAEQDFLRYTWPVILAFKENFLFTILNYGSYGEGSLPLFHIINAYLNPFSENKILFQASVTLISILNVIFFSEIIEKKYNLRKLDCFVYSSIFLLLPFFRSSAFWGLTENFGWLFLILAIKYFIQFEKKETKDRKISIFFICLFSSLALYTRPYLIFFPIFIMIRSFVFKDFYMFKYAALYYLLFSIPGIVLLYLWGGTVKVGSTNSDLLLNYHNPKFIFKNIVIFSSIFIFYFLPFELSKYFKHFRFKLKKILLFSTILTILLIFNFFEYFEYLKTINLGGGTFLKLNQILSNKLFLFLIISSVGLTIVINYITISKNNLILFFCLLIFCFPQFILQEYFEPLILILLFGLIDLNIKNSNIFKEGKTMIIFLLYYVFYYIGSFYYRYFFFNIN